MPLRTTAYATLAAQDLLKRHSVLRRPGALTAASMVLHHGADRWTAPTRIQDLVPGLGEYALAGPEDVDPGEARAENVPGLLLGLLVPGQPAADLDRRLAAISRALEHDPKPGSGWVLAVSGRTRRPPENNQSHSAMYPRPRSAGSHSLEGRSGRAPGRAPRRASRKGAEQGAGKGAKRGAARGRTRMISRLVTLRFGPETARTLSRMIELRRRRGHPRQRGRRRGREPGRRRLPRTRERHWSERTRPTDGALSVRKTGFGCVWGVSGSSPTSSPPAFPTCCSSPTAAARAGRSWSTSSSRPGRTRSCPCAPRSTPPSPHRISSSATPCSAGPEPLPPSPWCSTTAPTGGPRRRGSRTSCRASTSTRWPGRRTSTPTRRARRTFPDFCSACWCRASRPPTWIAGSPRSAGRWSTTRNFGLRSPRNCCRRYLPYSTTQC